MGTCRVFIVFLGLLSFSSAQQETTPHYKVEGTVINSLDGKPLPRVLVQCAGRAMLTGPEGEFSFDGLAAGRFQVMATKPGYFSPGAKIAGPSPASNIDVGPDTEKMTLKLVPEAVIFGRATGKDEEPLEGAAIQVLTFMSMNGRKQLVPAGNFNVRTDEDGNFHVAGLPAGRYYVAVKAGNVTRRVLGAQTAKGNEAYPAIVYYPGTQDLAAAVAMDLEPGQRMEAPFSLALTPAFKVAGVVTAAGEWKQVNPPMIVDDMEQVLFTPEEFDSQSGAFQFRAVPAGTYTLRLGGLDQEGHYISSRRKITISRTVTNLKLALQPGIDIPVVVRSEFSKMRLPGTCTYSLPGGELHQSECSDYPAAHVELIAADSARSRFYSNFAPMKDPSAFALHGVTPGKYVVRAQASFGGYVRSLRSGGVDLLREELVVPEGGSVLPIEVVVRDDSAMLKVQVHREKPGQQATVMIFSDGAVVTEPQMTTLTTNTEFQTGPLAPGTYKVFAFDSVDGLDYANPEVLAKYAASAASVTVAPNGSASVTVDVIHTGD